MSSASSSPVVPTGLALTLPDDVDLSTIHVSQVLISPGLITVPGPCGANYLLKVKSKVLADLSKVPWSEIVKELSSAKGVLEGS
jgi:hypothetical protein